MKPRSVDTKDGHRIQSTPYEPSVVFKPVPICIKIRPRNRAQHILWSELDFPVVTQILIMVLDKVDDTECSCAGSAAGNVSLAGNLTQSDGSCCKFSIMVSRCNLCGGISAEIWGSCTVLNSAVMKVKR